MENYEEWDVSIPSLPARSRLYHLEPIGIGTPYVESLTSYIARLAEAHCVTPKNLITKEILPSHSQNGPVLNYYYRMNKFWIENSLSLNGVGQIAKQWVEMLEPFTSCDKLHLLTMLTWSEVIGVNKLLRRSKAWCPACYEEWKEVGRAIYEPLQWALVSVDICATHKQSLVTLCPVCREALPFLNQITRPGYCSHCGAWLGHAKGLQITEIVSENADEIKWQYWVVEVVGELLSHVGLISPPSKEQIALVMSGYVTQFSKGNISALARFVNITIQQLWAYVRGTDVPYFDSLLRMCYKLSTTPLEFLTVRTISSRSVPRFVEDDLPTIHSSKRKLVSVDDIQRMQQALEAVIAEKEHLPSLTNVAKRMGYNIATVRKYCLDLSRKIVERHRRLRTEDDYHHMKQVLENALISDELLPLSTLAQQLDCDSSVLRKRYPELCGAIVTRYQERFDYEQIQKRLQEVLASDEATPSVEELARQMGYKRHILQDGFPDLCNQVSECRLAARRRQHDERMAIICEELRNAAVLLHNQGTYPSARQISNQLSDPHAIRTKEGHEAWRKVLEELGYPVDHLKRYI